eukprot:CAMPEP_0172753276 /NCGR_PEP_ID=MMETSP1074-20121228/155643_1 /TAXON_ID=2916 /ORGANISM="Ceratium fusus, Strain PA161109" /LENGTH=103 /DNA_ID=CAMNT_0013585917 /DNA_START=81 /DNA_END=392 /DNA_ORIENTATION=+
MTLQPSAERLQRRLKLTLACLGNAQRVPTEAVRRHSPKSLLQVVSPFSIMTKMHQRIAKVCHPQEVVPVVEADAVTLQNLFKAQASLFKTVQMKQYPSNAIIG